VLKMVKRRYQAAVGLFPAIEVRPAQALRETLAEGYGKKELTRDALAGAVVGVVALPLSMALAIASGVAPQHGLYTAIVGGFVIALLGGSRVQVSGPTAAFVVILAPISAQYGVGGLLIATTMAGMILVFVGLAKLGRLIQFVPHPVTTGFTAGIALVIATLQVDKLLGLSGPLPDHWTERVGALISHLGDTRWQDLVVGAGTMAVLLVWPRFKIRAPAPLIALGLAGIVSFALHYFFGFEVATINSKFEWADAAGLKHPGIPPLPPMPTWPWSFPGPDGKPFVFDWSVIRLLAPSAFAIAMLGAIESLLSAVVADGMSGTRHDPDAELVAQGAGNLIAPFFGGIAATGAIARTATNVRAGGRSPFAAMIHSGVVLLAMLALAPLLGYLPMAALASLLLIVAWNMAELKHFAHTVRVAPNSDVIVLLSCFFLTVLFDMVVSVTAGVMLAALLFMRRMGEMASSRLHRDTVHEQHGELPKNMVLYEIQGPLFFGAAQKAMSALAVAAKASTVVVLDLSRVPVMDVTGLVALESALAQLEQSKALVVLAGLQSQPKELLTNAEIKAVPEKLELCASVAEAIALAREVQQRRATSEQIPLASLPSEPPAPAPR
jgi:sulfate permease, SulP family